MFLAYLKNHYIYIYTYIWNISSIEAMVVWWRSTLCAVRNTIYIDRCFSPTHLTAGHDGLTPLPGFRGKIKMVWYGGQVPIEYHRTAFINIVVTSTRPPPPLPSTRLARKCITSTCLALRQHPFNIAQKLCPRRGYR